MGDDDGVFAAGEQNRWTFELRSSFAQDVYGLIGEFVRKGSGLRLSVGKYW